MNFRNIAIIAHVDHGKTTLVDCLLQQAGTFRDNQKISERALDSNELERERGITILAKCTSVERDGMRINIVDTPGHADFGGEVERILSMVDGVVVLVDAAEGPMPQTKFVLAKALLLGLKPIVFINKVDRPEQEADRVHNEVFDLFAALGANEEQLDFPVLFGSSKEGWCTSDLEGQRQDMAPLFDMVRDHVAPPEIQTNGKFRMLVTTLEVDPYLGRLLTGRITAGRLSPNKTLKALDNNANVIEEARVTKVLAFRGLERVSLDEAISGDIVALAGFESATVADTICDLTYNVPIPSQPIDPPTLAMTFSINDSPLAGQEGDKITSRMILTRLRREVEGNVAIRVSETDNQNAFEVSGRGELQLAVLIETMRREGYELSISRPRVILKKDEAGNRIEPEEEVVIDLDQEFSGVVVEKLTKRKGRLQDMRPSGNGKQRLTFIAPSRGLIGYHSEFLTDTRGTGIMNRSYSGYAPFKGEIAIRRTGVMISTESGKSVSYALWNLEERGALFIDAGMPVYQGMIIGEHARGLDLEVNPTKTKQLTNIRAAGKDDAVTLTTPITMSLEQSLAYIADDELVEVTPSSIRIRKLFLDPHERKREARKKTIL